MSLFFQEAKPQIEHMLGRPLTISEMLGVQSFAKLYPEQRRLFEYLAERQLVLCAIYLNEVCSLGVGEAMLVIDDYLTGRM